MSTSDQKSSSSSDSTKNQMTKEDSARIQETQVRQPPPPSLDTLPRYPRNPPQKQNTHSHLHNIETIEADFNVPVQAKGGNDTGKGSFAAKAQSAADKNENEKKK